MDGVMALRTEDLFGHVVHFAVTSEPAQWFTPAALPACVPELGVASPAGSSSLHHHEGSAHKCTPWWRVSPCIPPLATPTAIGPASSSLLGPQPGMPTLSHHAPWPYSSSDAGWNAASSPKPEIRSPGSHVPSRAVLAEPVLPNSGCHVHDFGFSSSHLSRKIVPIDTQQKSY